MHRPTISLISRNRSYFQLCCLSAEPRYSKARSRAFREHHHEQSGEKAWQQAPPLGPFAFDERYVAGKILVFQSFHEIGRAVAAGVQVRGSRYVSGSPVKTILVPSPTRVSRVLIM